MGTASRARKARRRRYTRFPRTCRETLPAGPSSSARPGSRRSAWLRPITSCERIPLYHNGSVNFAGVDSSSWAALPVDGVTSSTVRRRGRQLAAEFAGASAAWLRTLAGLHADRNSGVDRTWRHVCPDGQLQPGGDVLCLVRQHRLWQHVAVGTVAPTLTSTYTVAGSMAPARHCRQRHGDRDGPRPRPRFRWRIHSPAVSRVASG